MTEHHHSHNHPHDHVHHDHGHEYDDHAHGHETADGAGGCGHPPHDPAHGHDHDHDRPHDHGGRWTAVLLTVAAVVYILSGIRIVGPAQRGIVRRFGRVVNDHVRSGVHFGLPVGIDRLTRFEMRKTRRVGVGIAAMDRALGALPDPSASQFLSGDRNIVDIQLSVQYAVADPGAFLFNTSDPAEAVRKACESALCETVSGMSVDDVLTLRKAEVQLRVRELAQSILEQHGTGVNILSVGLERTAPPERVADAFRAVTSARADRDRKVAEAQGYREDLLPRARGEAEAIVQAAEADAYRIVALAEGRAERFTKTLGEARQASDLTRRRLHAETAEQVLRRVRKVLITPGTADDVRLIEDRP